MRVKLKWCTTTTEKQVLGSHLFEASSNRYQMTDDDVSHMGWREAL